MESWGAVKIHQQRIPTWSAIFQPWQVFFNPGSVSTLDRLFFTPKRAETPTGQPLRNGIRLSWSYRHHQIGPFFFVWKRSSIELAWILRLQSWLPWYLCCSYLQLLFFYMLFCKTSLVDGQVCSGCANSYDSAFWWTCSDWDNGKHEGPYHTVILYVPFGNQIKSNKYGYGNSPFLLGEESTSMARFKVRLWT